MTTVKPSRYDSDANFGDFEQAISEFKSTADAPGHELYVIQKMITQVADHFEDYIEDLKSDRDDYIDQLRSKMAEIEKLSNDRAELIKRMNKTIEQNDGLINRKNNEIERLEQDFVNMRVFMKQWKKLFIQSTACLVVVIICLIVYAVSQLY